MADPESESALHGTVTKAQASLYRDNSLLGKLPKRYKNALFAIKQSVLGERSHADMATDRVQHLEDLLLAKNMTIDALRQTADGWKETARRLGANVEDAPERSH